jgi:hypothetical protein
MTSASIPWEGIFQMDDVETVAPVSTVREAVGAFETIEALEGAISELASSGWDRSEMSLLAQDGVFTHDSPAPADVRQVADDPSIHRDAVVSDTDVRQGRTLATSLGAVVAAFVATGATIMSGGAALAAVIGAAAAGGGAAAAINLLGRQVGKSREEFLREQVQNGGILLWVATRQADDEGRACAILRRHGASNVHVHEMATE